METSPLSRRTAADRPFAGGVSHGLDAQRLHPYLRSSPDLLSRLGAIVWEADPLDFRTIFVSRQAEDVLGYPLRDWHADASFFEHKLHPGEGAATIARLRRAVDAGGDHVLELRMVARDGETVPLRVFLSSVCDWQGRPRSLHGVMLDAGCQRSETSSDGVKASPEAPSTASVSSVSGRGGLPPPRPEQPAGSAVDLNPALRALEPRLRAELGRSIVLRLSLEADSAPVSIEPGSLEQMLLCLIRYARCSMLQGGEFAIETCFEESADGDDAFLLTCVDTGLGLDAVRRASVFASLFDRHPSERRADGLLETVEEIVALNGGTIAVRNEPLGGTRFEIALPLRLE